MLDAEIRDQYGVDFLIRGSIQVMGINARLNLEITDLKLLPNQMEYVFQEVFMSLLIKSWNSCSMIWVSKL